MRPISNLRVTSVLTVRYSAVCWKC